MLSRQNYVIKCMNLQKKPENLLHELPLNKLIEVGTSQRIKIMALNIGSFWAKHKALECYINDHEVNVVIITESNVTENSIKQVNIANFACVNYCCRDKGVVKGGGGGGVLIFIHHTVPCVPGYNMVGNIEAEMEHCSTTLYPQYDYGMPLNIVGV